MPLSVQKIKLSTIVGSSGVLVMQWLFCIIWYLEFSFKVLISRWPRTLAGITSHQYCLQLRYPSLSIEGGIEQKKASRYCDRSGKWQEGNYSDCHYTNGITRVLHTFILVSSALDFAIHHSESILHCHTLLCLLTFNFTDAHQRFKCCNCGTSGADIHPGGCRLHWLCGCIVRCSDDGEVYGICQTAARSEIFFHYYFRNSLCM